MICYRCGSELDGSDICPECHENVSLYKKVMSLSNYYYNDALEKAKVRNLTGAIVSLQNSLKLNKNNIDARNLLGLIYYEMGEIVAALSQWVISKNLETMKNRADVYIDELRNNPTKLDMLNQNIKKYNVALKYCKNESYDVAIIQLKKVLSSNPKFLAAHKLLGLLYFNAGNYNKAQKEFNKALKIDNGDTNARRYLLEVEDIIAEGDESVNANKVGKKEQVIEYTVDNETIIQPIHSMQPKGTVSLISVVIGLVLGCLATVFLILPARIESVTTSANEKIASISEETDIKSAKLSDYEEEVEELTQEVESLTKMLDSYADTDDTVTAMNELMAAATAYIENHSDIETIASHLDNVDIDALGSSASDELTALYDKLIELVGESLGDYYYSSGYSAYSSQNYEDAITDLTKAYKYDSTNAAALYFLASSYYENGDSATAKKLYDEVMTEFEDTRYADNAKTKIAEINNKDD